MFFPPLFRIFGCESGGGYEGLNTATAIRPHAFLDGKKGHNSAYNMTEAELRQMVTYHVYAESFETDEFSSWASSLEVAW